MKLDLKQALKDAGVKALPRNFVSNVAGHFGAFARKNADLTVEDLLCRPALGLQFCKQVREANAWTMLPDDVILHSLLRWRKNPAAFGKRKAVRA